MAASHANRIAAVRRFNRFYTRKIGLLAEAWAASSFSLAEARVLYELTRRNDLTASVLADELSLDPGYLSRILRGFAARGLVARRRSHRDGRQSLISITARGRRAFAPMEAHTVREVSALLGGLTPPAQARLVEAMGMIEGLLAGTPAPSVPYLLRPPRPGDMGWVVSRHGALYGAEYGWDDRLEALTA